MKSLIIAGLFLSLIANQAERTRRSMQACSNQKRAYLSL